MITRVPFPVPIPQGSKFDNHITANISDPVGIRVL